MGSLRLGVGVEALVMTATLVGCEDDGAVHTPPLPQVEGRQDPGPPSAIKASTTPSRRLDDPGPRSAVSASLTGGVGKRGGGSR